MLGIGSIADFAIASFARGGDVTVLVLDKGELTLSEGSPSFEITANIDTGSLLLSGGDLPSWRVIVETGSLTLSGFNIDLSTALPLDGASLGLSGLTQSFMTTVPVVGGDLEISGSDIGMSSTFPVSSGELTLSPYQQSFMMVMRADADALLLVGGDMPVWRVIVDTGHLYLDGEQFPLVPWIDVEPNFLRLNPATDIRLVAFGGGNGGDRRRRRKTGLEPVKKRKAPPLAPEAPKVIMPPPDVIRRPLPRVAEVPAGTPLDTVPAPDDPMMIMRQVLAAQRESEELRFMRQDEQDAADIAEVLALID